MAGRPTISGPTGAGTRRGGRTGALRRGARHLLERLGLRVSRIRPPLDPAALPRTATAGHVVEFVGPSGVGKTTLFRHLAPTLAERWFFQEDIAPFVYDGFRLGPEDARAYDALIPGIVAEVAERPGHVSGRAAALAFRMRVLREDMCLMAGTHSRGFFIDDGLCHNASVPVLARLEAGDRAMERLVRRRAFVFLLADRVDTVVANIKARRLGSPPLIGNNFPGRSDAELAAMTAASGRAKRALLARLTGLGCRCLVLRAEDGLAANAARVLGFERQLVEETAAAEPALPSPATARSA
jgi:hypothetical protein